MSTSVEMSTNNSAMSSVYLSPFADTVSPVKPPLLHHQSLPRRKSAISMPSPTPDPKQLSNTGSRDPLLLFQDLGASGGGSLSRRNPMPPPDNSPPSRSFDPSFFSTSYPIDGRRSAEPFGALFLPSKSSSSHHRPSSADLVRSCSIMTSCIFWCFFRLPLSSHLFTIFFIKSGWFWTQRTRVVSF